MLVTEEDNIYVLAVRVPVTDTLPATANPVSVPTLVMLGCAAVVTVPATEADTDVFAMIAADAEVINPLNEAVTEVSTKLVTCVPIPSYIKPELDTCIKL